MSAWQDPRTVLSRHGIRANKKFSQNFLVSQEHVEFIARALGEIDGRHVLEIGPGVGTLTSALERRGATVTALEKDPRMVEILRTEVPGAKVVASDAVKLCVRDHLDPPALLIGNLPYAITGPILRRVVAQSKDIERAVVMVQQEVAERWAAEPGSKTYGAPTVFLTAVYAVQMVRIVPPDAFHPPPRVTSAVVRLIPLPTPRADPEHPQFKQLVKAAFGARRKTLHNAWKSIEGADDAMQAVGIDPSARGETLSVEQFEAVRRALET